MYVESGALEDFCIFRSGKNYNGESVSSKTIDNLIDKYGFEYVATENDTYMDDICELFTVEYPEKYSKIVSDNDYEGGIVIYKITRN